MIHELPVAHFMARRPLKWWLRQIRFWPANICLLQGLTVSLYPGLGLDIRMHRAKWRVRSLLFGIDLGALHNAMSEPLLREVLQAHPRLYEKVYRQYLVCGLPPRARTRLVCGHYLLACERFSTVQLRAIYLQHGIDICVVAAGNQNYTVRLRYVDQFEKEGELTLELLGSQGERVYCASFSLIHLHDAALGAIIGCLQGPSLPSDDARALIKQVTKALHGLRPKVLMISLVQMLCDTLGVRRLFGVRNAGHVYHCILNKRRRVKMDYDATWTEMGCRMGTQLAEIPLRPHHRSLDEIKSHKRSQYARRYALMDDLHAQIKTRFGGSESNETAN